MLWVRLPGGICMARILPCLWLVGAMALTGAFAFAASARDDTVALAVSDINAKLSVEGGTIEDDGGGQVQGSLTLPLGRTFGLQFDGVVGAVDREVLAGGAVHLFARNPARHLLGIYASHHSWDSIDITRIAGEAELYWDRLTLAGIAGWESIDVPGMRDGLVVANKDDDHGFARFDLSVYPTENVRISSGYRYENEESLAQVDFEYQPRLKNQPLSLFASGTFGDDNHTRITCGVRLYLGKTGSKSLLRRHREDDPRSYTPIFPALNTLPTATSGQSMTAASLCGNGIIEIASGEMCDDGNMVSGDSCSATCQIESCGNGIIDIGEACDDGNTSNGDGCSAICQIEFGSDIRLKRDIRHLATLDNGIKIYRFRYLWSDETHVGVMAQDLLADPAFSDAVVTMRSGFYGVVYAKLGLRMTTWSHWQATGLSAILHAPRLAHASCNRG